MPSKPKPKRRADKNCPKCRGEGVIGINLKNPNDHRYVCPCVKNE